MKVFVFGAGASKGSQGFEGTPAGAGVAPLTNELFDEAYASTTTGLLSSAEIMECRLASKGEHGLEAWLTDRWDNISRLSSQVSVDGERGFFGGLTFYIREVLLRVSDNYSSPADGYGHLLRRIRARDEAVGLVSFNYDTLLDKSIWEVTRHPLESLEDYETIRYFKPHGSINWLVPLRDSDPRPDRTEAPIDYDSRRRRAIHRMFGAGAPLDFSNCRVFDPRYHALHDWPIICKAMDGQYGYPAMLMPLTSKLYDHFGGIEDRVVAKARECFSVAREVYLVGYRAADDMIHDLLNAVPGGVPLHVADVGWSAAEIQKRVLSRQPNLQAGRLWDEGFMQFVGNYGT